jgi:hypothetical protein
VCSSWQLSGDCGEGVNVFVVVIDGKPDPQDIAANVGDAIARQQGFIPLRCSGVAESK